MATTSFAPMAAVSPISSLMQSHQHQCSSHASTSHSTKLRTTFRADCIYLSNRRRSAVRQVAVPVLLASNRRSGGQARSIGAEGDAPVEKDVEPWLKKLPKSESPLYSHALPAIEAWLRHLEFKQSDSDPAVWRIERTDWHAELTLEVTDLVIRYLKSGPGNLSRDIERRFSYALSRQDLEKAILAGP